MLDRERNERLCRIENDAPMGRFIRRFWFPAMMSSELPAVGDAPKPLRLLGEDLVVYRDVDGKIGVIDERCPHRGVSLLTARNEGCGLRCIYHGWLMSSEGVLDMPAEPHGDTFRAKVDVTSYSTREAGEFLWIYMGDRGGEPPFPGFEWALLPGENLYTKKVLLRANFVQGVEGTVDSSHAPILHQDQTIMASDDETASVQRISDSSRSIRPTTDRKPRIQVERTEYGFHYAALYKGPADGLTYARVTEFVAPFFSFVPAPSTDGAASYHVCLSQVPIDDYHTWVYLTDYSLGEPIEDERRALINKHHGLDAGLDENFELVDRTRANRWGQDRDAMARGESFTGVPGVTMQDIVVQEAQGPLVDRSREHVGAQDRAVSMLRKVLLDFSTESAEDSSICDPGAIEYGRIRPGVGLISDESEWPMMARRAGGFQPAVAGP